MDWINIRTSALRTPEYIGSRPVERATWLNVLAYCTDQENGGRIQRCASWGDRQWQQICGVTRREVNAATNLLTWDGDDLLVWNYPADKQAEVQAKRDAGRLGGLARTEAKTKAVRQNGALGGRPETKAELEAEPKQKPNGIGIGIGKEGNGTNTSDPVPGSPGELALSATSSEEKQGTATPERARNPLFDALATATGEQPLELTTTAGRAIGVALAEIRKASPDVTPEEIHRRAENYRRHMPHATLTAHALKAHWGRCSTASNAASPGANRYQEKAVTAEEHGKGFFHSLEGNWQQPEHLRGDAPAVASVPATTPKQITAWNEVPESIRDERSWPLFCKFFKFESDKNLLHETQLRIVAALNRGVSESAIANLIREQKKTELFALIDKGGAS